MKLLLFFVLQFAAALRLCLAASLFLFPSASLATADVIEIRLGHNAPVSDPRHRAMEEFAQKVSALSGGEMSVKIFPRNTIGQDRERLEQMQAGLLEMSLTGEILANFDSRWSVISMPYIWQDQQHLRRFLESEIVSDWKAETARDYGLFVLGFIERTPRILTTREKPVNEMRDLHGLKIRVPRIKSYMDTWRAFGVEPTPMSSSEFYLALQEGEIDGMENPLEVMSSWHIYDVSKYISFTNHMLTSLFLVASSKFLDELTPEQHKILAEAALETEKSHARRMQMLTEVMTRNLEEKGMVLIRDPDLAAFRKAATSVHKQYMNAFSRDVYDFIKNLAEQPSTDAAN